MYKEQYSRTIGLIGEEAFLSLRNKRIYIAGLGGVGGTAFIALLRMGFSSFVLIDKDEVSLSNLNRQILYKKSDLGLAKVEVAKRVALEIDEEANIEIHRDDVLNALPDNVDYIIDCVDDVTAKIALIKRAKEKHIPIVISMGMANKFDPSKIEVSTIDKSTVDPLAKKMRYELRKNGIEYKDVACVFSSEVPFKDGSKLNSLITVTSTAGLYLANYAFSFLKRK